MKYWPISVFLLVVVLFIVWTFPAFFGDFVWKYTRADAPALFLSREDKALKQDIAWHYFNGGAYDLEKAGRYYQELYDAGDRSYVTVYQLGRIKFIESKFNEALALFDEQLERFPERGRAHYMKGLVYMYTEDFVKAQESFAQFVKAYPEEWAGYNDLAWAYTKTGDFAQARSVAETGLVKFPNNLWLHNLAGIAQWNLGNLKSAETHFIKARDLVANTTSEQWGGAYPGNDPRTYAQSLEAMRTSVAENLAGVRAEMDE